MERLLLGVLNIGINAAVLILVGLIIVWVVGWLGAQVPDKVQKVYVIIVALIVLYQFVALIFGLPFFGVVRP
jgi:hypothetical protein